MEEGGPRWMRERSCHGKTSMVCHVERNWKEASKAKEVLSKMVWNNGQEQMDFDTFVGR